MNFSLSLGKRSLRISTGATGQAPAPTANRGPGGLRNVGQRMYGSAQVSRLTADWPITITSSDAEILVSAIASRSRLRQLERDDDYFRGMLWLVCNNVVGDLGVRLRLKARGNDDKLDKVVNAAVESAWAEQLQPENCTVRRNLDGIQVQRLAMRALARDGVALFRKRRGFANAFGYALEPIEVDRLDHWWNRPAVGTANEIKFGIELDQYRAHVAYWILTRHPGDVFAYSSSPKYRERVEASEIIMLMDPERLEQTIGMPLWPSVAKRLHNLYGYEESEQIAARAASAKGGWFKRDPKMAGADEYIGPEDGQGNKLVDTAPGQWEELPVGFEPVQNDPTHPTEAFAHFVKAQLRGAAAGSGIPYNSVAQDLESVNYSSYKAGMNDARDGFRYLQRLMVTQLMRPWYRDWLKYAILAGKVQVPIQDEDRLRVADRWKPRRWAGLEPLKEVQAAVMAVEAGFDSQRNVIEEDFDRDIEEVFDEQEHDQALADQHHLDFSASGIKKPVVSSGPVDTETGDEPTPKGNGNGNGNGRSLKGRVLAALKSDRWKFTE